MNETKSTTAFQRLGSLLLALVMVLGMIPLQHNHVHAAVTAIKLTDKLPGENETVDDLEEVLEFTVGAPIYVTASSDTAGDWLCMYKKPTGTDGYGSYAYWYYINGSEGSQTWENGGTYNIYDTVVNSAKGWTGWMMETGTYELWLNDATLVKTFEIVAPADSTVNTLEVEAETTTTAEPIRYMATSYQQGAWIGIYAGEKTTEDTFDGSHVFKGYATGHNGVWVEAPIAIAGTYTVVLFGDSGYTAPVATQTVEVTGESTYAVSTDKTEYTWSKDMQIMVSVLEEYQSGGYWVGLYKQGEVADGTGPTSIFYAYTASEPVNLAFVNSQRESEFVAGTYDVVLVVGESAPYTVIARTTITVTAEIDESKTVRTEPTCMNGGTIVYTYTDGTTKTVTDAEDESLKALGHIFPEDFSPNQGEGTHSKTCTRTGCEDEGRVVTVSCDEFWDDGVITDEPTATEPGEKTFTCSVCGGTRTEPVAATGATETGRQTFEPTCTQKGYTRVTYSDGTYQDVDFVPAEGHDYTDVEWTHVDGTRTHTRTCSRDCGEEGAAVTENCVLETNAVPQYNALYYSCGSCGDWYESILQVEKRTFGWEEAIVVTLHPDYNFGSGDWVGLYKKGETPNASEDPTSIVWAYVSDFVDDKMNILEGEWNTRWEEDYYADEYTLYLLKSGGFTVAGATNITITAAETRRETTPPTCTTDGYITAYYEDGTSKIVVTAEEDETLKATDHAYDQKPEYNGVDHETHTYTCSNNCGIPKTESCDYQLTETVEPENGEDGHKLYTCSVCEGTKTEVIPAKQIVDTVIDEEATCEKPGSKHYVYDDESVSDTIVIPALGHDYPDTWSYESGSKVHYKVCANNTMDSCTITENCVFDEVVVDSTGCYATFTCSVCGNNYVGSSLVVEKTEIGIHDALNYISYVGNGSAWVGLYKADELPGGPVSLYWANATAARAGQKLNMLDPGFLNTDRSERICNGDYVLYLFGDQGYNDILAQVNITVFTDMSETEWTVKLDGQEMENGSHLDIASDKLDETPLNVYVDCVGEAGASWWALYKGRQSADSDFANIGYYGLYCYVDEQSSTGVNLTSQVEFETGDYSIVLFEDSSYDKPIQIVTFSIARPVVSSTVIQEPTCVKPGKTYVVYENDGDENTEDEEIILTDPLGHDWGTCTPNVNQNTHNHTCQREDCGITEAEDCTFEEGICTACGGSEHIHSTTPVAASESSCTEQGNIAYHTCVCGKWFSDADATQLIEDHESVKLPLADHVYDKEVVDDKYVKSAATHTSAAEYYKSCKCGKAGNSASFTSGDPIPHTYDQKVTSDTYLASKATCTAAAKYYYSCSCGASSEGNTNTTFNSGSPLAHTYDQQKVDAKYLKSTATCTSAAVYYKSCVCGDFKTTNATFTSGNPIAHTYNQKKVDAKYLKSAATHTSAAVYYYSCSCGAKGTETFTSGSAIAHTYDQQKVDAKYLKTAATCTDAAVYYYSCSCGAKGTATFTSGKAAGHKWQAATCDTPATCSVCKKTDGEALGHLWQAATCETAKTCMVCTKTEGSAAGHKWAAATCTAPKTCTVCAKTEGAVAGHKWTAATCDAPKTCSVCKITEGSAAGHSYGAWKYDAATKTHTKTCTNNSKHTVSEACVFGDAVVIKNAVGNNAGQKQYTCKTCSGTYTEEFYAEAQKGTYERVQGNDRYLTAIGSADQLKKNLGVEKFQNIVVASGTDFADALSGSYLANQKNAPILLVRNNKNTMNQVKAYIKANLASGGTVYILGGVNAVPKAMESGLDGFKVVRLAGNTRYDTNLAILKEAGYAGKDVLVCTGKNFADGLSASAVNLPILLVKDSLTSAQTELLKKAGGKIYIIGGTSAVNTRIENGLKGYGNVQRIDGATRYITSVNIAKQFFSNTKFAVLAYGQNFPDGLSAGPVAFSMGAPVILTAAGKTSAAVDYVKSAGITSGSVIGGTAVISNKVATQVFK